MGEGAGARERDAEFMVLFALRGGLCMLNRQLSISECVNHKLCSLELRARTQSAEMSM